ncbi:MAG: type II toxin-antitoxin system prevent-host-death family antitoxin, partial [Candidatus Dormibacteraeota bacterium]|nr:type II toxin-antitoxin system prevent-host-death family antitoxin [Candidatus Dormibacteraeota bacterium]
SGGMSSVGIRELRDNVSAVIRRVAKGESIDVTDHGHPVARLVPALPGTVLERLIAEGRAKPAEIDLLDYDPPPIEPGEPPLSEVLAVLRAEER